MRRIQVTVNQECWDLAHRFIVCDFHTTTRCPLAFALGRAGFSYVRVWHDNDFGCYFDYKMKAGDTRIVVTLPTKAKRLLIAWDNQKKVRLPQTFDVSLLHDPGFESKEKS